MRRRVLLGSFLLVALCASLAWLGCGRQVSGEALYDAVLRGDLGRVRRLVRSGAPLDYRFDGGNTPLMAASEGSSAEIAECLLKAGARPNLTGRQGTALDMAASASLKRLLAAYGGKRSRDMTPVERQAAAQGGDW